MEETFGVTVISTKLFLDEEGKFVESVSVFMNSRKDGCRFTLEATTRSDIWYFSGQGNAFFIREKSGNFEK